jgi:hypothetical protein
MEFTLQTARQFARSLLAWARSTGAFIEAHTLYCQSDFASVVSWDDALADW